MSDTVLEALMLWICSPKKILVGNFSLPGLMLSLASERTDHWLSLLFLHSKLSFSNSQPLIVQRNVDT